MNLRELKQTIKPLKPLLVLESHLGSRRRSKIATILISFSILFLVLSIAPNTPVIADLVPEVTSGLSPFAEATRGLALLCFIFWLALKLLDLMHNSYYYRALSSDDLPSFEAALCIDGLGDHDLVQNFLKSEPISYTLLRLGLGDGAVADYLNRRGGVVTSSGVVFRGASKGTDVTVASVATDVYRADKTFAEYLFAHGVTEDDFIGAAGWAMSELRYRAKRRRWWSRERLLATRGIGEGWSYGETFRLDRYGRQVQADGFLSHSGEDSYHADALRSLEAILYRSEEADAIVVSDDEGAREMLLRVLAERIVEQKVLGPLSRKRIYLIDSNRFIGIHGSKQQFEVEFQKLMGEATRAGHVIVAFDHFMSFAKSAETIGVDLVSLLLPYLSSSNIQVVLLAGVNEYNREMQPHPALSQHFEVVKLKEGNKQGLVKFLEQEVLGYEAGSGVWFTYQAVTTIAESSVRYFTGSTLGDKVRDLLVEIVPRVKQEGDVIVTKDHVLALIEAKTGIPTGKVSGTEKDKLLNLEDILHKRVIGQNEAINAISKALRRARSGLTNPKRPLGSFLFLGPTGVGKTETTKALAEAFFGSEREIMRLDMSEYGEVGAVRKLIGSFESGEPGVLATMLREKQYGVLLLDELEKANASVHNLLLQVLDEGEFSDMHGNKVNARNLIVIATSNAGARLIFEAVSKGHDPSQDRETIVNEIIHSGVFKPEFINRFDGVIIFQPLKRTEIKQIANIMVSNLAERIQRRGVRLEATEDLLEYLADVGYDPQFGARPMNRAIQDNIEELIARELLSGSLAQGSTIKLRRDSAGSGLVVETTA